MYDRSSRQTQISAFLTDEDDIAEEDEEAENEERRDSDSFKYPLLSDVDEARLRSCLDEIHSVIGDSIPEKILVDTVLEKNFDFALALDSLLTSSKKKEGKLSWVQYCRTPHIRPLQDWAVVRTQKY